MTTTHPENRDVYQVTVPNSRTFFMRAVPASGRDVSDDWSTIGQTFYRVDVVEIRGMMPIPISPGSGRVFLDPVEAIGDAMARLVEWTLRGF